MVASTLCLYFEVEINRRREMVGLEVVLQPGLEALMFLEIAVSFCFFVRLLFLDLLIVLYFNLLFQCFL